tara:strand:- start:613 stop:1017 length:405 start_codon:yes stop_codon:yes gene_type:complete
VSLIENIKESEGYRSKVYKCTEGYDTIGYGFAIKDLELDEDICDMILERKVAKLVERIENNLPYLPSLPKEVQDVLIEMAYQMGVSGLLKFKKTLMYVETKDYKDASVEMLDSRWAKQTPNRAKKLSDIMASAG